MNLVFKLNDPTKSESQAILSDTDFLQFYAQLNRNNSWLSLKSYITQITETQVIPYIGIDFYTEIVNLYNSSATLTDSQTTAIRLMKYAVAYYAAQLEYREKVDTTTDAGNFQNHPQQTSGTSLGYFKVKLLHLVETGDAHFDRLLTFLDERVMLNDLKFKTYANSRAYLDNRSDFFRTTEEFQIYHNICNSRRTFIALLPMMRDAARLYLKPLLGTDMYNEMVKQYTDTTLTTFNSILIAYVRPIVAKYTVVLAASINTLKIENDGFKVVSNTDGFDARESAVHTRRDDLAKMRFLAEDYAKRYESELMNYLKDNAANYPTWQNSLLTPKSNDLPLQEKVIVTLDNFGNAVGGIMI